jgi:hypothetical protein
MTKFNMYYYVFQSAISETLKLQLILLLKKDSK